MEHSFFKIAPQCCDAGSYIEYGSTCVVAGKCYGELRPMGDYFWFAIPPKMGWPLESLILINWILFAISVFLSALAFRRLALSSNGKIVTSVFLLVSLVIHTVFLWPTIFNTLSDPPANLFLLIGFWLLILANFNTVSNSLSVEMRYFFSALCLGFSVWLRAFYLYPVIAGLCAYIVLWAFSKNKKHGGLLLLIAFLPMLVQVITINKVYGSYSYLKKETTSSWSSMHLNQPFVGYDTIFPRTGYTWRPQHCNSKLGILNGLQQKDYGGLACVIMERLYFYLGTYNSVTYIFTDRINQLSLHYVESIGDPEADWATIALEHEANVAIAPDGKMTADKLIATSGAPDGKGDVLTWVMLRGGMPHTFSVWLWSPISRTINLSIKRNNDNTMVARQTVTLTPVPTRYSVTGTTLDTALYDVDIGRTPYPDAGVSFGTQAGDFLYAWGAQLEMGATMTAYNPTGVASPGSVRLWNPALLLLNVMVLGVAGIAIIHARAFWFRQPAGVCILVIILIATIESVAIIPEQRFSIGWMIFFWLTAAAGLLLALGNRFTRHRSCPH